MAVDYSKIIENEFVSTKLVKEQLSAINNDVEKLVRNTVLSYGLDIDVEKFIDKLKTIHGIQEAFKRIDNYPKVCKVLGEYSNAKQRLITESLRSDFLNDITQLEITNDAVVFNSMPRPDEVGVGRTIYKQLLITDTTVKKVDAIHNNEIISTMRAHKLDIMEHTNEVLGFDICSNVIREVVECIHSKCETHILNFDIRRALLDTDYGVNDCSVLIGDINKTMKRLSSNSLYGEFCIIASPDVVGYLSTTRRYKPIYISLDRGCASSVALAGYYDKTAVYRDVFAANSYYTIVAKARDNKYQPLAVHIRDISTNLVDENGDVKYSISYTINLYASEVPFISDRCLIVNP